MKIKTATILLAAIISGSGCSDRTELNEANKKISQLELELSAEKAKNHGPEAKAELSNSKAADESPKPEAQESPTGSQWSYSASEDKMTGGTMYSAVVLSTNTVNFGFPYSGEQYGRLVLRTAQKNGKDVLFSIEKGQFLCRSYEDCQVNVRFDDGKPEIYAGVGPSDNSSDLVFIRNYEKFSSKLRKAKVVRISVNIYQQGAPVFEFDVSGFDQDKYISKKQGK